MKTNRAFTLLELLVVVCIITVLAGLMMSVLGYMRRNSDQVLVLNNMKNLAVGIIGYATDHDGMLPPEGEDLPGWESAGEVESAAAWLNSVPERLGAKKLADFANNREAFYSKQSLFFVPSAKYPSDKLSRPLFGISIGSKLRSKGIEDGAVRLGNAGNLVRTVLLQESGVPGEEVLNGQDPKKFNGQTKSYANRSVGRYDKKINLVLADGHGELLDAKYVVDPQTGKAYFPQMGEDPGRVLWTLDPEENANK